MDLAEMQQRATAADCEQQWQVDSELYADVLTRLFRLPLPTIAQVQGPTLAGGVGLVLACDLVVAAEDAFFALPEPVRGITAAIVTPFLTYRVGAGVAGQWLLSGQRIPAKIAATAGLCYTLAPATGLTNQVDQLVTDVLSGAPAALAITKRHWHDCSGATRVIEQAQTAIAVSAEARQTPDARVGLAAFLEKRPPAWARN
jgi:methylglutaconyl-CoA hydratase